MEILGEDLVARVVEEPTLRLDVSNGMRVYVEIRLAYIRFAYTSIRDVLSLASVSNMCRRAVTRHESLWYLLCRDHFYLSTEADDFADEDGRSMPTIPVAGSRDFPNHGWFRTYLSHARFWHRYLDVWFPDVFLPASWPAKVDGPGQNDSRLFLWHVGLQHRYDSFGTETMCMCQYDPVHSFSFACVIEDGVPDSLRDWIFAPDFRIQGTRYCWEDLRLSLFLSHGPETALMMRTHVIDFETGRCSSIRVHTANDIFVLQPSVSKAPHSDENLLIRIHVYTEVEFAEYTLSSPVDDRNHLAECMQTLWNTRHERDCPNNVHHLHDG